MNILVFDSNVVYAKQVCDALKRHVKDVAVDMAHNTAVLRHRLQHNCYELVIADVNSAMDTQVAADVLKEASRETPIVIWSAYGGGNAGDSQEMEGVGRSTQFLRKEFDEESIKRVLSEAVHPVP
jgi:CheY-like chemotaxis protein